MPLVENIAALFITHRRIQQLIQGGMDSGKVAVLRNALEQVVLCPFFLHAPARCHGVLSDELMQLLPTCIDRLISHIQYIHTAQERLSPMI